MEDATDAPLDGQDTAVPRRHVLFAATETRERRGFNNFNNFPFFPFFPFPFSLEVVPSKIQNETLNHFVVVPFGIPQKNSGKSSQRFHDFNIALFCGGSFFVPSWKNLWVRVSHWSFLTPWHSSEVVLSKRPKKLKTVLQKNKSAVIMAGINVQN